MQIAGCSLFRECEMLAGISRISLVALVAGTFSFAGLPADDAAAESIERNYYPRARSEQPANTGLDASGDQAATTFNSATGWLRSSPPSSEVQDTLSSRTQIYSGNRSVAPMLNTRSAPALESAIQFYETIVRGGGWGRITASRSLRPGGTGRAVVAVRRRLAIESNSSRSLPNGKGRLNSLKKRPPAE